MRVLIPNERRAVRCTQPPSVTGERAGRQPGVAGAARATAAAECTGGAGGVKITSLSGSCPWPAVNLASARRSFRSFHWRRFACGRWSGLAWIWSRGGGSGCRRPSGCSLRVGRCLSSIQHLISSSCDPLFSCGNACVYTKLRPAPPDPSPTTSSSTKGQFSMCPPVLIHLRPEERAAPRCSQRNQVRVARASEREQTRRFFRRPAPTD
jgi:hypothetical protein